MKVFISYNHNDQSSALRIYAELKANGLDALIDCKNMSAGQPISEFILGCIKESDVTLLLLSAKSLQSPWVAMETMTGMSESDVRQRRLIPAYLDTPVFDDDFTIQATKRLNAELQRIDAKREEARELGIDPVDLDAKYTRYRRMNAGLSDTVLRFQSVLCIDLSPEHFGEGLQKIISDLKGADKGKTQAAAAGQNVDDAAGFDATIANILDDATRQELESSNKRLKQQQTLLASYEEALDRADDPKTKARCQYEIDEITPKIEAIKKNIKDKAQAAKA